MRQLTSLDAQFLALENSRQTGHVGSLAMLDAVDRARRDVRLRARSRGCSPSARRSCRRCAGGWPRCRSGSTTRTGSRRPRSTSATTCARWRWRRPGPTQQLADQVARIMSRPLDRARPLWELYVIEGHESGLVAVLTKIHHAVIDGLSRRRDHGAAARPHARGARGPAAAPSDDLADPPPSDAADARARAARPPALPGADAARAAEGDPEPRGHAVRRSSRASGTLVEGRGRCCSRDGVQPRREPRPRPKTSFNGRISPHRRFVFGQLLARASSRRSRTRTARRSTTSSCQLCAGAVRRWLIEHDDLPDEPLVAQVPVSVRTGEQFGTYGNRILLMAAPLFTDDRGPGRAAAHDARGAGGDEGAPPRAARRAAAGRQQLHPARGLRARRAADVRASRPRGPAGRPGTS